MKNYQIKSAAIIAFGIIVLGLCIKLGLDNFAGKDRMVTVKGLAEREVEADKVTWPIQTKEIGNDLPALYKKINATNAAIKRFLLDNGIKENEININAPTVIDLSAERYNTQPVSQRYNITSNIIVTSSKVKLVRSIIAKQGELLQQGIAIVDGGYEMPIKYDFVAFKEMKPKMMEEAISNAEQTALQFAKNSHSKIDKIMKADQGQFSIDNRDENTPYIKKVRVVSTVTYSLKN